MSNVPSKVCAGPAHAQPTRLPLTDSYWHFNRSGRRAGSALTYCKLCRQWQRMTGTLVPAKTLQPYARELVERCGGYLTAQRLHGINDTTLFTLSAGRQGRVKLDTARRLLVALGEQRKLDRRNGASKRFIEARKAQALSEQRMRELTGY